MARLDITIFGFDMEDAPPHTRGLVNKCRWCERPMEPHMEDETCMTGFIENIKLKKVNPNGRLPNAAMQFEATIIVATLLKTLIPPCPCHGSTNHTAWILDYVKLLDNQVNGPAGVGRLLCLMVEKEGGEFIVSQPMIDAARPISIDMFPSLMADNRPGPTFYRLISREDDYVPPTNDEIIGPAEEEMPGDDDRIM